MSKICCPMCGSDQIEMIAQPQFQPPPNPTQSSFPKPPMHSLMHYLVNYAAMGATGARMLKGQKPMVLIIGAVIGGAVGCAACLLNHLQDAAPTQPPTPSIPTQARGQTSYQCLECEYCFALAFQYEPETTYPIHHTRPFE
ncbi:hypothetical protein HI850_000260 [bacterium SPL81]|uniref:Uncharacterized protein n=1 Tax=Acinetobacter venetianus (strain ATCC 31012 / DSM 23050 / BCRC 14357 / CCUG 45561 / CIP 110063 / KCTC 2702 / LMG 19082 / RAG-1) TaxID=1191460 RepID=N8ZY60_ACIVR|nr:hypothetical protein [Acinetobacter venetianus]ENV36445.1 hypothetical protein F959_02388 [Acinetobacter venetianus RAG-1 = CIP 110063]MBC9227763.1 hypothetical protein [Acinetobacter baumannii]